MLKDYYNVFNYISMNELSECIKENKYNLILTIISDNKYKEKYSFLTINTNTIIDYSIDYLVSEKLLINIPKNKQEFLRNYDSINEDKDIVLFFKDEMFGNLLTKDFSEFKKNNNNLTCELGYLNLINFLDYFDIEILDHNSFKKMLLIILKLFYNYLDDLIINILFFGLYNIYRHFINFDIKIKIDDFLEIIQNNKYEIIKKNYKKRIPNRGNEVIIETFNHDVLTEIKNEFYKHIKFNNNIFTIENDENKYFKKVFENSNIESIFFILLCKIRLACKKEVSI